MLGNSMSAAYIEGNLRGPNWPVVTEVAVEGTPFVTRSPRMAQVGRQVLVTSTDRTAVGTVSDYQTKEDEPDVPNLAFFADDLEYPTQYGYRPVST